MNEYKKMKASQLWIALLLLGSFVACADQIEDWDTNSTEKNFGQAANIVYKCAVATQAQDGTTWRYEVPEIMNLMSQIKISVFQNETKYGPLNLNRSETDTFTDGNLTVKLTQLGDKKSIKVEHASIGHVAKADNGWCTQSINDQYSNGPSQDNWSPENVVTEFKLKVEDPCENPCSFRVKAGPKVRKVVYDVDGWVVAESEDAASEFAVSYTFNTIGNRRLSAVGLDQDHNYIASESKNFVINGNPSNDQNSQGNHGSLGPVNVPYYYQFNNGLYPSSSCQNTSIAMVLSFLGVNITPDDVTREFTKDKAQSVSGFNYVFNTLARRHGVRTIDSHDQGSFAQLKAALDRGEPVVVHGFFTGFGHVLVVTGYDENGYYANDPAGTWSQIFKGGYNNAWNESTQGKNIYYRRDAFERAIATYDGYSFTSLYLHILR